MSQAMWDVRSVNLKVSFGEPQMQGPAVCRVGLF
jgi:hypothetical protein